ncbi:MAG: cytochrome-c peroxidase [Ardenticatenia bacterium]|nr:cytochrome-c peroxidase [Ardenticatenia bacterium]
MPATHPASRPGLVARTLAAATGLTLLLPVTACRQQAWTAAERATLRGLSLASLPPLPPDPSNSVADRPEAAALGHRLFFDPRLSADGKISCAHCHQPALRFTDGLPLGEGIGRLQRHTPSVVGTAFSPWQFWDGRTDSQWSQALQPMEHPLEMGLARTEIVRRVGRVYGADLRRIFGSFPELDEGARFPAIAAPRTDDPVAMTAWEGMQPEDRVTIDRAFAQVGKVIAAYERKLQPGPSAFDRYVDALERGEDKAAAQSLDQQAQAGLALFIGKAQCINCHNGPRLTNDEFHNIGLPLLAGLSSDVRSLRPAVDLGREPGVLALLADPFNCLGTHSDADKTRDCAELRYVKSVGDTLPGAFKVPSLRGVSRTAPYMHDGRFQNLAQVVAHYNAGPVPLLGHSDLKPLLLTLREQESLVAFLEALDGPLTAEERWLRSPTAP